MKVLLDANIVKDKENAASTNSSVDRLFRSLDRLGYEKTIHRFTVEKLAKSLTSLNDNSPTSLSFDYTVLCEVPESGDAFTAKIAKLGFPQDHESDCLLYQVYSGNVDALITEDGKKHAKAETLGISKRVLSIDDFINATCDEKPELIEYKHLSVKKVLFKEVDLRNSFFDSFRKDYPGFDEWFKRKGEESAYICQSETDNLLGFLYIKVEQPTENYQDIYPALSPKRRLKIGTFKVESTGFRLGERFIKIIFDNALKLRVEEIYVTLFSGRSELEALNRLLVEWGFKLHGIKKGAGGEENVLVKELGILDSLLGVRGNFPNLSRYSNKFIVPILPEFHTVLLPDAQLKTESEEWFFDKKACRYSLQKVYVSWSRSALKAKPGDLLVFYRMAEKTEFKKYKSVLSSIGMVDEIVTDIRTEKELLKACKNRSVFSEEDLKDFWSRSRGKIYIVKFLFVTELGKRLILEYLWDKGIVERPNGPRPFTRLTDEQFDMILSDSGTSIVYAKREQ